MLNKGDLELFRSYVSKSLEENVAAVEPLIALTGKRELFTGELKQIIDSLEISKTLNSESNDDAVLVRIIWENIRNEPCKSLEYAQDWKSAISWARSKFVDRYTSNLIGRNEIVARSCLWLKSKNYEITISEYGVIISDDDIGKIANSINSLVALLGGKWIIKKICQIMSEKNRFHDEMWLMGNDVPGLYEVGIPKLPIGWIWAVAIKHLNKTCKARKPDFVWKNIEELSTHFAASQNCQRYSQYEDMDVCPSRAWTLFKDSIYWQQFFTIEQIPKLAVKPLKEAILELLDENEKLTLGIRIQNLYDEFQKLSLKSFHDKPIELKINEIQSNTPLLFEVGLCKKGEANNQFQDPIINNKKNQNNFIFYETNRDKAIILPTPFLTEAFCQLLFKEIRANLKSKRYEYVSGKIYERVIANACRSKCPIVYEHKEYDLKGENFDLDVACVENDSIVFFETKAKALTSEAKRFDIMKMYGDFADSYVYMLKQLSRSENHFNKKSSPLNKEFENSSPKNILKIAVSPLSYGPISDKVLLNGIIRSFYGVKINPTIPNEKSNKITNNLNKEISKLFDTIEEIIRNKNTDKSDIFSFLIDAFWLDFGQILFLISKAKTISSAFHPIKYCTFSTRDFWTEYHYASLSGLASEKKN